MTHLHVCHDSFTEAIAQVAHERGVLFHTDASQSVGKVDVDVVLMHVDFLTIAGTVCVCVAARCRVLQCDTVCFSVLSGKWVFKLCSCTLTFLLLQVMCVCVAVWCCAWQRVVVRLLWCSVVQCGAV